MFAPMIDWAESVQLDGVGAAGGTALVARLARYPGRGRAWLWLNVFLPDGSAYAFHDNDLALTDGLGATDPDAELMVLDLAGPAAARFERDGRPAAMRSARLTLSVPAHPAATPPAGAGTEAVQVRATFTPDHPPHGVRPGRLEVLGRIEATIETPAGRFDLRSGGKWHEQRGERPRFAGAFTYANLYGEGLAFQAAAMRRGAFGVAALADGTAVAVERFEIDPPAPRRRFAATLAGGATVEGRVAVVHAFSVPVEGRRRPGTIVTATTNHGPMAGIVNDWQPGAE